MEGELVKTVAEFGSTGVLVLIVILGYRLSNNYFPKLLEKLDHMKDKIADNTTSVKGLTAAIHEHIRVNGGNGKV